MRISLRPSASVFHLRLFERLPAHPLPFGSRGIQEFTPSQIALNESSALEFIDSIKHRCIRHARIHLSRLRLGQTNRSPSFPCIATSDESKLVVPRLCRSNRQNLPASEIHSMAPSGKRPGTSSNRQPRLTKNAGDFAFPRTSWIQRGRAHQRCPTFIGFTQFIPERSTQI